jgi:hypothetical protein
MGLLERAVQGVVREIEDRFSVILSQNSNIGICCICRGQVIWKNVSIKFLTGCGFALSSAAHDLNHLSWRQRRWYIEYQVEVGKESP